MNVTERFHIILLNLEIKTLNTLSKTASLSTFRGLFSSLIAAGNGSCGMGFPYCRYMAL